VKKFFITLLGAGSAVLLSGCCGSCGVTTEAECAKCLPGPAKVCPGGSVCPPTKECPVTTKEGFIIISTEELEAIVADKSAVILDARSGKYDDGRRVPGALSLNDKSTASEISKVVKTKDQKVVTYCANPKCPASARLAKHLKKLGYTNVVEYPLGIQGWAAAGKKIEQAK